MKLVICIKQVPFVDQLKFDVNAGRLIREGVESEINPFDKRAIAEALDLKQKLGAETIALTMGPPQAAAALREALAMGVDRAVHILGREFAGADTIATARTLALAIRKLGFDIVFCGKYSTDAETAQVPPMLAEFLDIPQVTGITQLDWAEGSRFIAKRETDDGFETVEGTGQVLFSTAERLIKPIKVAPKTLEGVKDRSIETLGAADLSPDASIFGIGGSPTWVEAIHSIEPKRKRIVRDASVEVDAAVIATVSDLKEEGLFGEWKSRHHQMTLPHAPRSRPDKSIWTIAELIEGEIRHVTFELIGRSIELADKLDGEVGVLLAGSEIERHVATLSSYGADKIFLADAPELAHYLTEPFTNVVAPAINQFHPFAVLFPSTANGRDMAPRIAARLGLGLTGDCIGLEIDDQGRLVQLKPAFGGNIVAPILTRTSPAMATIRAGMLQKASPDPTRTAEVVRLSGFDLRSRVKFTGEIADAADGVRLDDADVIVGVGTGIGDPENLVLVRDLARVLNASMGATRRAVDAGWLPRQVQIGLTGRSISPGLYVTLGVRGAFNHTVGIQRAGIILAINNNQDAEIFEQCDYGLIGDWKQITLAFIRFVTEKRKQLS